MPSHQLRCPVGVARVDGGEDDAVVGPEPLAAGELVEGVEPLDLAGQLSQQRRERAAAAELGDADVEPLVEVDQAIEVVPGDGGVALVEQLLQRAASPAASRRPRRGAAVARSSPAEPRPALPAARRAVEISSASRTENRSSASSNGISATRDPTFGRDTTKPSPSSPRSASRTGTRETP